jgi:hypothetical protein
MCTCCGRTRRRGTRSSTLGTQASAWAPGSPRTPPRRDGDEGPVQVQLRAPSGGWRPGGRGARSPWTRRLHDGRARGYGCVRSDYRRGHTHRNGHGDRLLDRPDRLGGSPRPRPSGLCAGSAQPAIPFRAHDRPSRTRPVPFLHLRRLRGRVSARADPATVRAAEWRQKWRQKRNYLRSRTGNRR